MDNPRTTSTLLGAIALGCLFACSLPPKEGTRTSTETPAETALTNKSWPNLNVLKDYPNPFGDECGPEGKLKDGSVPYGSKAEGNILKNRFRLPEKFEPITFAEFQKLPSHQSDIDEKRAVSLVAYVKDLRPAGTKGESVNCGATRRDLCDIHIDFINGPENDFYSGKELIVGEVTERIRRLAKAGHLKFSSPNGSTTDWSSNNLRDRMLGRWVRVKGWLFFDRDHVNEDARTDPNDDQGNTNWRGTSWEIHPIMEIEVLNGKPAQ